ncbi:hypothetical protein BJV82DRAFT_660557 [Fennellomyces sp. T-0311]|nr:hypothetical protein BJV82DRAFT_660557 [Fennellomyces sp. T-0311]
MPTGAGQQVFHNKTNTQFNSRELISWSARSNRSKEGFSKNEWRRSRGHNSKAEDQEMNDIAYLNEKELFVSPLRDTIQPPSLPMTSVIAAGARSFEGCQIYRLKHFHHIFKPDQASDSKGYHAQDIQAQITVDIAVEEFVDVLEPRQKDELSQRREDHVPD